MDWELNGDSQNIIDGEFTGTQSCEAFVFNPQTAKCTLLSGLAELNLRESTRYYSGYLECPEPEETFNSSVIQPPADVIVTDPTCGFTVRWGMVLGASGYLINCIPATDNKPLILASATDTSDAFQSIVITEAGFDSYVANTTYTCYVSSYTYTAVSKGWSSGAFTTTCP